MTAPTPPMAPKKPHSITIHGHTRTDDYYWLRDRNNPDVIAYLEAENNYTDAVMAHTAARQQALYDEMLGRIQETDLSVPVNIDDYYYYVRTEAGQQYPIYCRKKGSLDASETVLLDLNEEAEGLDYISLGVYEVSPDHTLLAYSIDTDGSETYTVYVKNLQTGERLSDQIPNTSYALEWGNDNHTLFYTTQDHAKRSHQLHRHILGTDVQKDVVLYHEADERFRVSLYKTRDQAYIVLSIRSIETSELHTLQADLTMSDFRLIQARQTGLRYALDHRNGLYYILTNDDAINYKLVTTPVTQPEKAHWQTYIPHRDTVKLDDFDVFANHLVLYERENGLKTLRIQSFDTGQTYPVDFPEPVYTYSPNSNPDFHSRTLRFTYMSLTTPDSVFDYDMETRTRELKKQKPVLGEFDPACYQSERMTATAPDGAQVPISLVYRRDMRCQGPQPCVLYGYGAYGANMEPWFSSNRLSLLDRGCIFAIAHIRGGQELGRQWYDEGKLLHKRSTFTDFIACAEALVARNYTRPDSLAIMGGSAGGLLVGAVLNMAPALAHAAVAQVPFVDILTTMLDTSLPLTVGEYEEWGDPNDPTYYDYILSYSPYDNVTATSYPHLLITAGLNDPRVQYWEPAKWAAKLRSSKTDANRLLLKTNMGAGHGGASGRYDFLKEIAFEYAFILDILGIGDQVPKD
jgi:oligopeptidase B